VTVLAPVVSTVTVQLAPASYSPPRQVQATVFGTSSALDIALIPQTVWIAQGATLSVPLTARVLSSGAGLAGRNVDFQVLKGSALLASASVASNASGYATDTLEISAAAGDVQVSVCVQNQPTDSPCLSFRATAVPLSGLMLQPVSGNPQLASGGQSFAPVVVRVTDPTGVHAVIGATVIFNRSWLVCRQTFPRCGSEIPASAATPFPSFFRRHKFRCSRMKMVWPLRSRRCREFKARSLCWEMLRRE
jgi:hypothetical protein